MTKIVRSTNVKGDNRNLTVSTIKLGFRRYETVIFDNHTDNRHAGKTIGGYVINNSQKLAATREQAMEDHREALYAARTGQIS